MPLEILQNGRYRILRQLGSGSMGEVYLVEDTRINRQVAIKVIRTESSSYSDPNTTSDAARLFEREARAVARLNHPNILPLFDFGEEVINGAPLTYMVMPFCQEGSLATWLQQHDEGNLLSPIDVAHFLHQAADALQHAHDNDIIHQDVKPQNFLIRSNRNAPLPDLLLADFGIAKLTAGTSGASQAIRGTPIYMAPEQWEGHPVPASDQYALAVMIYQLLTGRPPFQGGPGQMMYQHFSVAPQPPSAFNPSLTHDVDSILLHALAKRPENRFVSVSTFGKALQEALLIDGPTRLNTQNKPIADTIHATLAISYAEAINGTSRTLTLMGGRRIKVEVPAGIQDGQVIQVLGQDTFPDNRGIAIPLLLTIAIAPTEVIYPSVFTTGEQGGIYSGTDGNRTNISNNSTRVHGTGSPTPVSLPYYNQVYYNNGGSAVPFQNNQAKPPRTRKTGLTLLLIGLVLLLLIGSAGLAFYYFANSSANDAANATATALANNNTATSQNGATSTSQANALATSAVTNATATA